MKRLFVSMFLVLAVLTTSFSVSTAQGRDPGVNILIQVEEGSQQAVVNAVQAAGGEVRFDYQNVPALAVTLDSAEMPNIANLSGVIRIEKDRIVNLTDELEGGKNNGQPMFYEVESMSGVNIESVEASAIDSATLPEGYANFLYTGAASVWAGTDFGEGTTVAVVDTGTVPNVCLSHAVVGAPGFPDGYNATGDGVAATDPANHWHGTHVGGVIASSCSLTFADPTDVLYQAISAYLPWDPDFVPILGQAPNADLYPVKVFPASGAGVPTSVILDGLDHVLTLKKDGLLDVDVVNMSLGGPTVADGRDTFDLFIKELVASDILVVTSAGNDGPIPNTVGSPATSFDSVSVGALDYAPSSRVLYEYIGYVSGLGPGQGMVMRPTGETRVTNFSSRGPLSDVRDGPEISALGFWNFHVGPQNEIRWATGTSFSGPTVAGGAALLNAYWEAEGFETAPDVFRNVLLEGADPNVVAQPWQDFSDQGYGALDVPASLDVLMNTPNVQVTEHNPEVLKSNVLGPATRFDTDTWESDTITLNASEKYDAVFDISRFTSNVTIEVFDIVADDNSAYAYWPNALEVHVQSAKRTSFSHPVEVYWYPYFYGGSFDVIIEDGPWTFAGNPWTDQPMEPGLMKLSLIGDYSNESPVSFKVRITRENNREPLKNPVASNMIKMGDSFVAPVEVPDGTSSVTFDLNWLRKWDLFPTSDLDMLVFDPNLNLASLDGATGNAPERVVIDSPEAGTWYIVVDGYELTLPDTFNLFATFE